MSRGIEKKQINLLRGWPAPSLLPASAIRVAAEKAFSNPEVSTPGLLYGPDPGYQPLRESIQTWLNEFYEPSIPSHLKLSSHGGTGGKPAAIGGEGSESGDRICITGGASQNLACILQVFTDPGFTKVWMVAPAYFLAERIFEDSGLQVRGVGEGAEGIDLESLERYLEKDEGEERKVSKKPKPWSKIYRHIIYCVPSFSNPSGRTMTLAARLSLVGLARKYDALVITDDVYDFLQWPATSHPSPTLDDLKTALLPRIVDLDRVVRRENRDEDDGFGNAVSNGSFSKIVGPGVRTGWAEASPKFIYGLSQCGSSRSGGAPSQLTATMINELLASGELNKHIETILKPTYARRWELTMTAIYTYLVPLGVSVNEPQANGKDVAGGYFIWITLPMGVDAETVSERCKEDEGLVVAPGRLFEVTGVGRDGEEEEIKFERGLRLCFAWVEEEDLKEGVRRLSEVVMRVILSGSGEGTGGRKVGKVPKGDLGEFR